MSIPLVSVVMPAYNSGEFIREAIDSILNQTFTDFEFIIINDGSTDDTELQILQFTDPRIRYFLNVRNKGNAWTRNKGMQLATGKYIAWMDSDDIAISNRLRLQVEYLESHPHIGILGGANVFFDEKEWFVRQYPPLPEYIKAYLWFKNPMAQPTVMLRREEFLNKALNYNPEFENGEDYDLWFRASQSGIKFSNLPDILLLYRFSDQQLSHTDQIKRRTENMKKMLSEKLSVFKVDLEKEDFEIFFGFINGRISVGYREYHLILSTLTHLEKNNNEKQILRLKAFSAVLFAHKLRLMKYYFLECGKPVLFLWHGTLLVFNTGISTLWMFRNNEGRYLRIRKRPMPYPGTL